MRRLRTKLFIITLLALVVAGATLAAYRFIQAEALEEGHVQRDETELIVVNTTGGRISLFRAGKTLADASAMTDFDGSPLWLPTGSYFLKVDDDVETYYPISIRGYRQGNQDDGSLAITVRQLPEPPESVPRSSGRLLPVPSGDFLLGDRANPAEPHYAWTQAFFIGQFEVTNGEFREFLESPNGFSDEANWSVDGRNWKKTFGTEASSRLREADPEFTRFGQNDMPVTNVTWFEAAAYCKWLTQKIGNGLWIYSMPNEAEWEKAARGPDGFDYGLGQSLSDAETVLYNWKKNPLADVTVFGAADSRRLYKPNRYGLYHLCGNVAEWTQSVYRPLTQEKPYTDDDRNGEDTEGQRVVRGGSWYSASRALLYVAYRDAFQPAMRHNDLGFRIVARRLP